MKGPQIPKRYTCIAKIGDREDGSAHCVKYRLNDILKFEQFLVEKFGNWVWIKVYSNKGENKREHLAYYNRENPPKTRTV